MNKGISFYWGFKQDPKLRAEMLSKIGFDCVIANADPKFDYQNGKISKQIKLFRKNNLKLSSLHMRYNANDLPYFWTKGCKGRSMEKRLIKDVKIAYKYGFKYVVVHLRGEPNSIGLTRLKRVLNLCDKLNIDLAIENINRTKCFAYVFDNIQSDHLKFCYDSGHNNCFDPEIDYLTLYGDKLVCLHLHDNDGTRDAHTLNKYGNIDWDNIAYNLAKINFNGSLDYELLCPSGKENCQQVAREVYKQACELEKMINKYKKQLKIRTK